MTARFVRQAIALVLSFALMLPVSFAIDEEVLNEEIVQAPEVAEGEAPANPPQEETVDAPPQEEAAPAAEEAAIQEEAVSAEGEFTPYDTASQEIQPSSKGIDERISLDLRNIEVTEALRFLAMKGGLNLAVSKNVQGRLMLLLNDVPIRDVLDIILLTNELAYDKQGDIYNIMTEAEYKARYGRKFSDARRVKIFQLKYAVPDQVFAMLDALKSELGRVLVDPESGTALVVETDSVLKEMEEAVATLEKKRSVRVFNLQYANAKDVEERLKIQLDTKNAGSIVADERSNSVIVQTFPDRMGTIAELVQSLDSKTKEVLIVSKIIKITLSDDYSAELKWEGFFKEFGLIAEPSQETFFGNHERDSLARTGTSFVDDFISITPTTRPTQGSKNVLLENVFFGMKGEENWEAVLKYLRTIGETRILSSPRLTVVNNQEAKIHVGEREAYVTTTTTAGQSTTTTAEAVTFVDVGIQLNVTPTINDDGWVTMKIKPEISSVSRSLTTPSNNKIPIIDTSEAETTVMVKDGTSIVIAGLRKDEDTETRKQIPFIGDLPIIGRAFRNVVTGKKRTEVLVLLTPHILAGGKFTPGMPKPPSQAMKPYREYSDLTTKPPKKEGWLDPVAGLFKKVVPVGHD